MNCSKNYRDDSELLVGSNGQNTAVDLFVAISLCPAPDFTVHLADMSVSGTNRVLSSKRLPIGTFQKQTRWVKVYRIVMFNILSVEPPVSKSRLSAGLGLAYETLGLRAGEARVDAIREAAQVSANSIHELTHDHEEQIVTLADVATSAYRLLDPRKRARRIERIQLSIFSERDLEMPQKARRPLFRSQHCSSAS